MQAEKSDDAVISKKEAAKLIGVSIDTLDRMDVRKDGPARIRLSDRRVGYRMRELRAWLKEKMGEAVF